MDNTFLQSRITATQAQIVVYEDAITALGSGNIQTYTLDTGQSRTTVTKLELNGLQKTLDSLYNRLVVLEARLTGNGALIGRPGF